MSGSPASKTTTSDTLPREVGLPVTVGLDGDGNGWAALDWALSEAVATRVATDVIHVHHVEPAWRGSAALGVVPAATEDPVLVEAASRAAGQRRGPEPSLHSLIGSPAQHLVRASRSSSVLVVGAPRHGALGRVLMGSTAVEVAARAHCPVVIVRDGLPPADERRGVVVGADGSAGSRAAITTAFRRAARLHQPVTVVHAWHVEWDSAALPSDAPGAEIERLSSRAEQATAEVVASCAADFPDVVAHCHTVMADPLQALVEASHGAELVVVGTHGRGELAGLVFGSVSQGLLRRAHAPVMVVRSAEHAA
ncbi:universal stress protein [Oryzobacter terrae]|uniref:universal stress protein n=1 Tax=Oryzobacter terrae TaxID=1620385 RepID=UPI00366A555A